MWPNRSRNLKFILNALFSSDDNFDLSSGTDLGEGDSADDDVYFELDRTDNDVNEVVLDNRGESSIHNWNGADVWTG